MRTGSYLIAAWLIATAVVPAAHAADFIDNLDVCPALGYGYAASKDGRHGTGYHAGVRMLSSVRSVSAPEPDKRWGIEISSVSPFESRNTLRHGKYTALGLVLEQVLPARIVATIGTIGYLGADRNKDDAFGVLAGFAWEPKITERVRLSVGLRIDTIYDASTVVLYSLSAGLRYTVF